MVVSDEEQDVAKSAVESSRLPSGIFGQSLDVPLHGILRFTLAMAGAMTLFIFGSFVLVGSERGEIFRFLPSNILIPIWIIVLPAFFASIISLPTTRFSHTAIYLHGVLVPAVTINIAKFTWIFWN